MTLQFLWIENTLSDLKKKIKIGITMFIIWKWISPGGVCLCCQSLEPNQVQTWVSRSEDVAVLINNEKRFLRQVDMEKEKRSARQHAASRFRSQATWHWVKKGETMEEIRWEGVQGSRDNCGVDDTKVMYEVCLLKCLKCLCVPL